MTDQGGDDCQAEGQGGRLSRLERFQNLLDAIEACDWQDAEMVMSTVLEEARADAPLVPFGDIEDDAEFWAAMATYEELRAYFLACGKRLARRQLGRRGKIRLAQLLLADLPDEDRRAVVASTRSGGAGRRLSSPNAARRKGLADERAGRAPNERRDARKSVGNMPGGTAIEARDVAQAASPLPALRQRRRHGQEGRRSRQSWPRKSPPARTLLAGDRPQLISSMKRSPR